MSATRLHRALVASAAAFGVTASVDPGEEIPWASATYVGARHAVRIEARADEPLKAWLAALPEQDLRMPGQFVASLAIVARLDDEGIATVRIETLTVLD